MFYSFPLCRLSENIRGLWQVMGKQCGACAGLPAIPARWAGEPPKKAVTADGRTKPRSGVKKENLWHFP